MLTCLHATDLGDLLTLDLVVDQIFFDASMGPCVTQSVFSPPSANTTRQTADCSYNYFNKIEPLPKQGQMSDLIRRDELRRYLLPFQ